MEKIVNTKDNTFEKKVEVGGRHANRNQIQQKIPNTRENTKYKRKYQMQEKIPNTRENINKYLEIRMGRGRRQEEMIANTEANTREMKGCKEEGERERWYQIQKQIPGR